MRVYDLGRVPWLHSQLVYHALPRLGMEGLVLLTPREPYVCVGYHQSVDQEVDLQVCREMEIPVFRREVGGGAVYLDDGQTFYQVILSREHRLAGGDKATFYRRLLAPAVETFRQFGVPVEFKPVNDIVTADGRKISGNGAGEIHGCAVLVGNVIVDFDYDRMVQMLQVPDEKFRDKVHKSLRENLTTLSRELEEVPSRGEIVAALWRNFEKVLGPLEKAGLPPEVWDEVARLEGTHTTTEWLHRMRPKPIPKKVKILSGTHVLRMVHKAPGGLIRATLETQEGRLASLDLSGDFFIYPPGALAEMEAYLAGLRLDQVEREIERFFEENQVESPGVSPHEWAKALGVAHP